MFLPVRILKVKNMRRIEIQRRLNALLGTSEPGYSKEAKALAEQLKLNFARNL